MAIGVGTIGFGKIVEALHAPCLTGMEDCELIAVCDPREERLTLAKSEYGCEGYTDVDAFLNHPDLDLVVAAVPNYLHGPMGVRALEAGKNVVVEKPWSFSLPEADWMVRTAREKRLVATTHQNRRWDPDYLALKHILESGEMGKLLVMQTRSLSGPWRHAWATKIEFTGSGPFMSFGPHLLDQVLTLMTPGPIQVSGIVKSIIRGDDYFNSLLTFADGATVQVELSKGNRLNHSPRFHLSFEKGDVMVTIDENRDHWLHTRLDGEEAKKEKLPDPPEFHLQSRPFYQNVFAAIRGEESLIVAPEQSRRYVATAAAILQSSQEHKTIEVNWDADYD